MKKPEVNRRISVPVTEADTAAIRRWIATHIWMSEAKACLLLIRQGLAVKNHAPRRPR